MSSDAAGLLLRPIQLRRNTAKNGQASADSMFKNHWPKGIPLPMPIADRCVTKGPGCSNAIDTVLTVIYWD